ncbi:Retrovirus-related Pol polyprotein from transposon TNT 1-94 [Sesbania bispinosa]|nr:Retrovirus-related Pol polyprotein from transposon TNT 1-94 [Sesbania bispinosa]
MEGSRSGRGSGRYARDKHVCEVCGKQGHVVVQYFHRFDKYYIGHSLGERKQDKSRHQDYNALIALPNFVQSVEWYFDSGAHNHVNHDPN